MIDTSPIDLLALVGGSLKRSGKQHAGACPFCGGDDRFYVDVERNAWGCRHCTPGYHDALTFVAKRDSLDLQTAAGMSQALAALGLTDERTRVPVASTKRSYADLADYAQAHGLSAEQLMKYQWHQMDYQNRPALRFKTAKGYRYRFLDGKYPKYKSVKGYEPCLYGIGDGWRAKLQAGQPAVLCNGEISTIAAAERGVAAFCITSGEKSKLPGPIANELRSLFRHKIELIVAMDCDTKGRASARGIVQQMQALGVKARAVDLGLSDGGDLADFCMLHGDDTLAALKALPDLKVNRKLELTDMGIKLYEEIPDNKILYRGQHHVAINAADRNLIGEVTWLIDGEIPDEGVTVLFGASGVGKSFLAIDYALQLAQQHPVYYMAGEGERTIPPRIDAWYKHHKRSEGHLVLGLGAVHIMDSSDFEPWLAWIVHQDFKLVVVDTLNTASVGIDENKGHEASDFMDRCHRIAKLGKCAVLLVHHTNKGGVEIRGSQRLFDKADSVIALVDDDEFVIVECQKTKAGAKFRPRTMMLLPIKTGTNKNGQTVSTPVIVPGQREAPKAAITVADLTASQQKIMLLFVEVFEHGASTRDVITALPEIHEKSVMRILSRLKRMDLLSQAGLRAPYRLTDKGCALMGVVKQAADDEVTEVTEVTGGLARKGKIND